MDLARVIGTVVATQKSPELHGVKFCVVQPLDENLEPVGPASVAVDATASRGSGEIVYYITSAEAGCTSPEIEKQPADEAIGGIVDHLDIVRKYLPEKN